MGKHFVAGYFYESGAWFEDLAGKISETEASLELSSELQIRGHLNCIHCVCTTLDFLPSYPLATFALTLRLSSAVIQPDLTVLSSRIPAFRSYSSVHVESHDHRYAGQTS